MSEATRTYIRIQARVSALINMLVNPTISWLGNRAFNDVPVTVLAIDMGITCVLMSFLISLFVSHAASIQIRNGRISRSQILARHSWLARLPASAGALGIALGVASALVLIPLTLLLFFLLGLDALPFWALLFFKLVYTGLLAFFVTRWVILRTLMAAV